MPVTVLQAPLALALTAGSLVLLCSASKSPLRSVVSHIQSFFFLKFPVTIDPLAMQSCFSLCVLYLHQSWDRVAGYTLSPLKIIMKCSEFPCSGNFGQTPVAFSLFTFRM